MVILESGCRGLLKSMKAGKRSSKWPHKNLEAKTSLASQPHHLSSRLPIEVKLHLNHSFSLNLLETHHYLQLCSLIMAPTTLNFITGNKNKLSEVNAILGDTIDLQSKAIDLPEIQGTIEEISLDKCRRAADAVSLTPPKCHFTTTD